MSNVRLQTVVLWQYVDDESCYSINSSNNMTNAATAIKKSPMSCYFPHSELVCQHDSDDVKKISITNRKGEIPKDEISCPQYTKRMGGTSVIRAATTEYLFTRLSNTVIQEAERQLNILFGSNNNQEHNRTTNERTNYCIPKNLITVHIRWGDKGKEMLLVPIQNYTNAVQQLLDKRKPSLETITDNYGEANEIADDEENVNILLSTEDPEAVEQFMAAKPKHWKVYLDQYYVEMLPYRNIVGNVYNANVMHSSKLRGRNGLIALGSLLVAMESNDFVLTTGSNWSRLMNEIRKNIVDPRCNYCTNMIDLMMGEY